LIFKLSYFLELESDFNICHLDPNLASQMNTDLALGLSLLFILNYFVSFQRHNFFQSSTDAENPQGSGNATKCQVSMKSKHCYAKFHVPAILAKNKQNYLYTGMHLGLIATRVGVFFVSR
jgi:hypothetical protein